MKLRIRTWAAMTVASAGIMLMPMAAVPAGASVQPGSRPAVTVLISKLGGPRHLMLGPGGLYVTVTGNGGKSCESDQGDVDCEGETGQLLLFNRHGVWPVLSRLPSIWNINDKLLGGVSAVTFNHGMLAVLFQDDQVQKNGTTLVRGPGAQDFGKLMLALPLSPPRTWHATADFARFAAAHPQNPKTLGGPPGQEDTFDSDPYDIIPYHGGYAVADAAANDVLWVSPCGHISVLTRLPTVPESVPAGVFGPKPVTINAQAVPTSLAVGPNGALYVGVLRGVPSLPGTADIYRVVPGKAPVVAVHGLTTVTAIAFDREGRLLATEYNTGGLLAPPATPGALVRVSNGKVTVLPVHGLMQPSGLAIGRDGAVYVANNGNSRTTGQVLRITGLG